MYQVSKCQLIHHQHASSRFADGGGVLITQRLVKEREDVQVLVADQANTVQVKDVLLLRLEGIG